MGDITNLNANTNTNTNTNNDTNTYISKIYSYLEYLYNYLVNILVIKDNTINDSDSNSVLTQTKKFILKYRRIIGIFLLIGLLYIDYKCNTINKIGINKIGTMKGGSKLHMSGGAAAAAAAAGALGKVAPAITAAGASGPVGAKQALEKGLKTANNANPQKKDNYFYRKGAYAGEQFKDFSGWLYQILFSIAITIAICMIILPSLCFVIITVICFFLLKKKMAAFKSL